MSDDSNGGPRLTAAETDSDMLHAMSVMLSAHADLIQSMAMANKGKMENGKDPVFSDEDMKKAMVSGMQFVPQTERIAPEHPNGGQESSDDDDPVVVPLFGTGQGGDD